MAQTQNSKTLPKTISEALIRNLGFSADFKKSYGIDPGTWNLVLYSEAKERGLPRIILEVLVEGRPENKVWKQITEEVREVLDNAGISTRSLIIDAFKVQVRITIETEDAADVLEFSFVAPAIEVYSKYKGSVDRKYVAMSFSLLKRIETKQLFPEYEKTVFKWYWGYKGRQADCGVLLIPRADLMNIESAVINKVKELLGAIEEEQEEVEEQTEAIEEQPAQPQPQIELPELELELDLEAAPQSSQQPQQAQQVHTAVETTRKNELVRIYLLKMRLPSKYLVQKIKIEENGQGIREIRDFSDSAIRAAVASRLEGIRRKAYELIERHFVYVDSYGMWIAVTEEAVERAKEVNKWIEEQLNAMPALKQLRESLPRYFVRAVEIYMKPEEAKELLYEARRLIESELEELRRRIEEAEKEGKKRALRLLEQKVEYKQALLEAFKRYLESLGL